MANCHRKFRIFDENPPPPPPPPPPMSSDHPFSPILIFMFCGLIVSFTFICYLVFATRYRRRLRNLEFTEETHGDLVNQDLGPVIHHPIWLINTIGLDQSQIESIDVFKYKKDQGLIEGTDCSVCLNEFEDDESLRLLPKCSHAFHVPCIDTWLRSHKNCPLCRAPIFNNTSEQTESTTTGSHSIEARTTEETPDSETVDHQVIEVESNGEVEKSRRTLEETSSGARVRSDLVDHHRVHGERSVAPLPVRRSASMDLTSASMVGNVRLPDQESMSKKPATMPKSGQKLKGSSSSFRLYSKAMKSSSFGHSSQKASSFTNKYNRSY